jgi:hypothetical protein
MQDNLFFHFEYDLERRLEDLISLCLNISLPSLHLVGTREIHLNFTNRDDLNQAIDTFRAHTAFFQDMEIERIEFQYRGEFYIKYSVPALSEAAKAEQAEFEKSNLKKLTTGRRGGKRRLHNNLWEKLA